MQDKVISAEDRPEAESGLGTLIAGGAGVQGRKERSSAWEFSCADSVLLGPFEQLRFQKIACTAAYGKRKARGAAPQRMGQGDTGVQEGRIRNRRTQMSGRESRHKPEWLVVRTG